ncbi:MAG: RagB/SusD family nutrient uptake outer membrane protein [Bacteroidota bacterium]|nr:RagB/SusD family nutrient uptake outer membrane protein [Bacteroidota bacterium]MDE2957311.1 RagB/SusD family nutrient uptake outer membrane protein [Bacteroidota bacterium]
MSNQTKTPIRALAAAVCLLAFAAGCTDLTDSVDSQVKTEDFFQTPEQFVSAMGDAYSALTGFGGGGSLAQLSEATADHVIVPARGQDWSEGGFWYRVNSHQWTDEEFGGYWTTHYRGVNNANRLIFQFEQAVQDGATTQESAAPFISELLAMRALYYYWLLDAYGNVPIVTDFTDTEPPSQPSGDFAEGRRQVFQFVESELQNNLPNLSTDSRGTYGRMNQWVAHMTLAKLYMNAEVYTGTGRWGDALTHLNAIINSGSYSLAANYHDNFITANDGSPENIFVVPYDRVFLTGFNLHQMTLHYGSQNTYNFQFQPWNGWSATQRVYESVIDPDQNPGPQGEVWGSQPTPEDAGLERVMGTLDDRLGNFLVGPQYTSAGDRITDTGIYSDFDLNGPPLTFTPAMNDLESVACRQCGARIGKYQFDASGIGSSLSNDFVVFRYADVLLLKAEALWRQNSGSGEALALVNQIRMRAGVDPFTELNADRILGERGRELFWEQTRRQDLIRFDGVEGGATRYNDPWQFKDVSGVHRNVAAIPEGQLQANSNLVQNPGY